MADCISSGHYFVRICGGSRIVIVRILQEMVVRYCYIMDRAERVGFEPTVQFNPYTRFPSEPVQPLLHLSEK